MAVKIYCGVILLRVYTCLSFIIKFTVMQILSVFEYLLKMWDFLLFSKIVFVRSLGSDI